MGFFKRLSKLQFGKIGKSFAKTLKQGKIARGTGFDDVINGAAQSIIGKDKLKKIGNVGSLASGILGLGGKPKFVPDPPVGSLPLNPDNAKLANKDNLVQDSDGDIWIDVNNDGKDDTLYVVGAVVVAAIVYFKFVKK